MKLLRKILALLLVCALLCASAQAEVADADDAETNAAALRGLFVHTLGNRDFPSAAGLKTSQIKDQLADIVTTARMGSFNAIFFEARPAGDSFYNSRIFPKSRFLTGKQGAYALIDPLKLLVEKAKAQDIAVYAVVDPYYLGNSLDELHRSHPAAREPALTIEADGGLYLDPALAETDILNTDDIARMAKRYDLAGIIVEGVDRQSLKSQPDYSLHVLELMEGLSDALGDDPADPCLGIVLSGSADGSVLEDQLPNIAQAVDLIFPVISAPVGYQPNSFQDELAAWIRLSGVEKICPVSDAGRILSPETDGNWVRSSDEPLFALYTAGQAGIDNRALEGMNLLRTSRCELLEKLATAEAPTGSLAPDIDLSFPRSFSITRPAADLTTSYSSYYIMGTSDPGLPLLMDGEEISRGAQSGLFGKLVTLSMGKNQFTFSQDGESRTVTITRTSGGISAISTITAMSPASSTLVRQGNTLTFTCTAPSGSAVSISFLGRTVQLTQQAWASASAPATFKGTMKVSSDVSPSDQVSSLGPVSYTLVRAGKTTSYTSKGEVYYVGAQATPALEVTDHVASVLYDYTVNGVFKSNLRQGTTDAIAGEVGEYYELASGGYIAKATARVLTGLITVGQAASDIIPSSDDASENFLIPGTSGLTFAAEERENGIDLTLYNLTGLSRATLSESELFSSIRIREEEGHTVISFDTRSQKPVWGWDVMSSDQGTRIYFCRAPALSGSFGRPLEGVSVVLDPGHGGTDPGALGTPGTSGPSEKDLNLAASYAIKTRLEQLGASVTLTRSRDEYPTLFERMKVADAVRPHFFLSVHHNSVVETADASLPSGTEIYYHYESGSLLAQRLAQNIANDTGRINRGFYESYYVVTKMSQAPAVLMELGFMPNPVEYERAASPLDMYRTACAVSTALIEAIRGY